MLRDLFFLFFTILFSKTERYKDMIKLLGFTDGKEILINECTSPISQYKKIQGMNQSISL